MRLATIGTLNFYLLLNSIEVQIIGTWGQMSGGQLFFGYL
jgi:hypothetical protein